MQRRRKLKRLYRSKPWTYEAKVMACVLEHFPPREYPRVADVGGGKECDLACWLTKLGYEVTVIDPACPKRMPRGIKAMRTEFLIKHARKFDLLVGLAPCEASQKLIHAAKYRPIIFWPCNCRRIWPRRQRSTRAAPACFRDAGVPYRKQGKIFWCLKPSERK